MSAPNNPGQGETRLAFYDEGDGRRERSIEGSHGGASWPKPSSFQLMRTSTNPAISGYTARGTR